MNRIEFAFIKSHIKKAIWNLECANKQKPNTIDVNLIIELKLILSKLENNQ